MAKQELWPKIRKVKKSGKIKFLVDAREMVSGVPVGKRHFLNSIEDANDLSELLRNKKRDVGEYRQTLEAFSKQRLNQIEWEPTTRGNVKVLNATIDLYRYFDATRQAEFLYECVQQTVEKTLPEEVAYLKRHDRMRSFIEQHFDMPDKLAETLIAFMRQGCGKLSKRARTKEFDRLTDEETAMLEEKYSELFGE